MNSDTHLHRQIPIVKAGINKSFDEGMIKWSEEKLRALFSNYDLGHPTIQATLKEWHDLGYITLHETPELYLIVETLIP